MHLFTQKLLFLKDDIYKDFSKKLIPDTKNQIIGVRAPLVKNLVKEFKNNKTLCREFLSQNHFYHEEFLLHGLIIGSIKDINEVCSLLNDFVQKIDNWAVCDMTVSSQKILKKHPNEAFELANKYIQSTNAYVVRFAIVLLLAYFLDNNFTNQVLNLVTNVKSDHYYVNMAKSWFFSVALVKQYTHTIKILENKTLDKFVHNKTIQKAIESFRISKEIKTYLRTLKI